MFRQRRHQGFEPLESGAGRRARKELTFRSFSRLDRSAVLFSVYLYCLIHWVVRVLIQPNYTIQEAKHLILSQSLQLGYTADSPPMLSWLLSLCATFPGLSGPVIFGLKYILLGIALTFYYLSARNVLTQAAAGAAALAGLGLTYIVGWGVHEDMFDAVGLMLGLSLCLHALTRIITWRRLRDWAYLGFAIGFGQLTHHLTFVLPVAILVATLFSPFFRGALSLPRILLTLVCAALVYAPYGYWLATHTSAISDALTSYSISWDVDSVWVSRAMNGAGSLGEAVIGSMLPLILFWITLFWSLWLPVLYPLFERRSTDEEPHETAWRSLVAASTLIAGLCFAPAVLVGIQTFKTWWLLPFLYPLPIWLAAHVKRAGEFPVTSRAFAAIFILISVLVLGGRFVEWRFDIESCRENRCLAYSPIAEWSEQLRQSGFKVGTIVGADEHLTGNLRAEFPHARVADASYPPRALPPPTTEGACLAVWRNTAIMPEALADYLVIEMKATPIDRGPEGAIRRNLHLSQQKASTLYFQFVPPSSLCR